MFYVLYTAVSLYTVGPDVFLLELYAEDIHRLEVQKRNKLRHSKTNSFSKKEAWFAFSLHIQPVVFIAWREGELSIGLRFILVK